MNGLARIALYGLLAGIFLTAIAAAGGQASGDDSAPALRQAIVAGQSAARARAEIQLGAFRDEASATLAWHHIAAEIGPPLDSRVPQIEAADVPGKGRFWRLRIGFDSRADAKAVCAVLRARGVDCLVAQD